MVDLRYNKEEEIKHEKNKKKKNMRILFVYINFMITLYTRTNRKSLTVIVTARRDTAVVSRGRLGDDVAKTNFRNKTAIRAAAPRHGVR